MRRGLVGDDVDLDAAAQQLGEHLGRVADHADGQRPPLLLGREALRDGVVEVRGDHVEVAVVDPALQPALVDVDDEADAAVHRDRQRLRAAHAAAAGGQRAASRRGCRRTAWPRRRRTSRRCPAGCPGCRCRSTTRRSSGRTSSGPSCSSRRNSGQVAQSPTRLEFAISTRGAHSWVRSTPTGRPDCTSIVSSCSSVVRVRTMASKLAPVAGGLAGAAVDDQVVRVLGHLGVEVVLQHPQRGLGAPAPRGQGGAARGADRAGAGRGGLRRWRCRSCELSCH